ncbi:MAG TPA: hypothetical protein VFY86_13755 [Nocardioides sp.]|nr:hypothetical protein [Nocardioides sp.]
MARYVIDAPTLLHVIDQDLTIDPGHQLVARNAIRSDALQLLLDELRAGRRDEKDALAVHQRVTEQKMRLLGDRVSRAVAWQLAQEHGWADVRGAENLAITRLQADALVTVDPDLAARAEGVVPVADVEVLGPPG